MLEQSLRLPFGQPPPFTQGRLWPGAKSHFFDKLKEAIGLLLLLVRIVGLEPTRRGHRNLNPTRLPIPSYPLILLNRNPTRLPVAVPDIFVGGAAPSSSVDRCHALSSLYPPPAALASLPNSTMPAYSFVPLIFTRGGTRGGALSLIHS